MCCIVELQLEIYRCTGCDLSETKLTMLTVHKKLLQSNTLAGDFKFFRGKKKLHGLPVALSQHNRYSTTTFLGFVFLFLLGGGVVAF